MHFNFGGIFCCFNLCCGHSRNLNKKRFFKPKVKILEIQRQILMFTNFQTSDCYWKLSVALPDIKTGIFANFLFISHFWREIKLRSQTKQEFSNFGNFGQFSFIILDNL